MLPAMDAKLLGYKFGKGSGVNSRTPAHDERRPANMSNDERQPKSEGVKAGGAALGTALKKCQGGKVDFATGAADCQFVLGNHAGS
jgi:hypothetical protein